MYLNMSFKLRFKPPGGQIRGGLSLYPTRPARLDSTTESGPGSTQPAQEAKMLRLNRLDASLFRLKLGRFFMKNMIVFPSIVNDNYIY